MLIYAVVCKTVNPNAEWEIYDHSRKGEADDLMNSFSQYCGGRGHIACAAQFKIHVPDSVGKYGIEPYIRTYLEKATIPPRGTLK